MDDLELDRELRAVLGETPAPDFAARVRARIAQAPPPSLFAGWITPAAAIACAVVIVGVALQREYGRPDGTELTKAPGPTQIHTTPSTSSALAGLKPGTTSTAKTAAVVVPTIPSARPTHTKSVEPPLPEVIIAPEDVEALRQFVTGASEVRFVASFDPTPAPIPWVIPEPVEHNN